MKKIIWVMVSCLMTLSLVMASCGPAEEEEAKVEVGEEEVTVTEEEEEVEEEVEEAAPEVPKYGGVLTTALGRDVGGFDDVYCSPALDVTLRLSHEELMTGDWTKGPAGTGEYEWANNGTLRIDSKVGSLAESWEIPEVGKVIFHIRKGVHFALNLASEASRLVNGREITADDIVLMLNEIITNPRAQLSRVDARFATITAPDEDTVVIELPESAFMEIVMLGDYANCGFPREVTEKYGLPLDWQTAVGTGPFILTDYVASSSCIFVRNPNYWETDPIGPGKGNQLPYLDGVKLLIITDVSTSLAAVRTARLDVLNMVDWEDAESLIKTSPELVYKKFPGAGANVMFMRQDKEELPFHDKNVRRALMMATDFETIKRDYCGGEACIVTYPIPYVKEYGDCWLGLDDPECPESVKELYVYNPEKAKQLLADAGYPDGFKTTIVCQSSPRYIDYLSIVKDQWAKVNVELEIDPKDAGVVASMRIARSHEEMFYNTIGTAGNAFLGAAIHSGAATNLSYVDDPIVNEAVARWSPLTVTDPAEAARMHKELMKYVLDQAWAIPSPATPQYHFWWPWLKNYHGEFSIGRQNEYNYAKYVWLDQDLKKSMGY